MADLTIGEIIALAHAPHRLATWLAGWVVEQWQCACGRAPIFYGSPNELRRCTTCGRPKPKALPLGVVTKVDHERKTITASADPHPLSGVQANAGTGHIGPNIRTIERREALDRYPRWPASGR